MQKTTKIIQLGCPYPKFFGRKNILQRLDKALASPARVVLYGPEGVGKSEIANTFANAHLSNFSLIWWFNAENQSVLERDFRRLAQKLCILDLSDSDPFYTVLPKVYEFLEKISKQTPYLLIFDNVKEIIPFHQSSHGRILLTSRKKNITNGEQIEIKSFSKEDALELFNKILKEPVQSEIIELANYLDYFPLALIQAAHYIRETSQSILSYLCEIKDEEKRLPPTPIQDKHYPISFATFWKMIFETLKQRDPQALEWLKVIPFFHADGVPLSWLTKWLAMTEIDPVRQKLRQQQILRVLLNYALISYNREKQILSVPSSQHALLRTHLSAKDEQDLLLKVSELILTIGNELNREKPKNEVKCISWKLHAQALLDNEPTPFIRPHYKAAAIKNQLGIVSAALGKYNQALGYFQQAFKRFQARYNNKPHKNTAIILDNIGNAYHDLEKPKQELDNYKKALKMLQALPNKPYLKIFSVLEKIITAYLSLNDFKQVIAYGKKHLKMLKTFYPNKQHPDTPPILARIAYAYLERKKFKQSLEYSQKSNQMFNVIHPNEPSEGIAYSLYVIGNTYYALKQYETATKHLKECIEMYEKIGATVQTDKTMREAKSLLLTSQDRS